MVIYFFSLCYSDVSSNFKEKQKIAIENKIPTLSGKPLNIRSQLFLCKLFE